jgi:hypothetical protein
MLIRTEVLAPTDTRGARVLAQFVSRDFASVIVPWHYDADTQENHYGAACYLLKEAGVGQPGTTVTEADRRPAVRWWFVQNAL